MRRVLTPEKIEFIKAKYQSLGHKEMATQLGVPKGTVTSAMRSLGLKVPKEIVQARKTATINANYAAKPHPYDDLLRTEYLITNVNQLSIKVGRSETYVKTRLKALGLIIPPEIIAQRVIDSRIQKGQEPANKGKKQVEYMTPEQIAKSVGTRFKKGQRVHNEAKDGDIRIRHSSKARGGKPYKMIRLAKSRWKELQIYNWEALNGPVPKKHVLACKDRDTLNCDPSNWELITMADNAMRNQNREKAAATMKRLFDEDKVNNPMRRLHDNYIAAILYPRDKEARLEVLKHPELIQIKRLQLTLQRNINAIANRKDATEHAQ